MSFEGCLLNSSISLDQRRFLRHDNIFFFMSYCKQKNLVKQVGHGERLMKVYLVVIESTVLCNIPKL